MNKRFMGVDVALSLLRPFPITSWLVLMVSAVFLAACGSTPKTPPVREADLPKECVYPDAPAVAAPTWICDEKLAGQGLFQAVGTAQYAGNLNLAERAAAANARAKIALRIQADITSELRDYAKQAATVDGKQVNSGFTDVVTSEFVDKRLSGTFVAKKITSPTKLLYVLVGIDPASVQKMVEDGVNEAKKKDAALEKLNADEAFNRLSERVDKERARE